MQRASPRQKAGRPPKVVVCLPVDWFALSHFRPLVEVLCARGDDVLVVTGDTGRLTEFRSLGARTAALDFRRATFNPFQEFGAVRALAAILAHEKPDIVHLVSMKPIVLGCFAIALRKPAMLVLHMTGLGFLATSNSLKARTIRRIVLRRMAAAAKGTSSWLLVENPEDAATLRDAGLDVGTRVHLVPGSGIDPAHFSPQATRDIRAPVIGYVGRMLRSKGLADLIEAHAILRARGIACSLQLFGRVDPDNPEAISEAELLEWAREPGITWHGHVDDVRQVWACADIFALPARTREGMPRALLEAAACARPLIVSDVPGCRHFVRDGINGLLVPPEQPAELANALERLVTDAGEREKLGAAARTRLLDGYTEQHVKDAYRALYAAFGATSGSG